MTMQRKMERGGGKRDAEKKKIKKKDNQKGYQNHPL